jgi:nitroreductase
MKPLFEPLHQYRRYPLEEMKRRSAEFLAESLRRRSVRQFSSDPVPMEVIEDCLRVAGAAPSGANQQPWHFVVVQNPVVKQRIRRQSELQEKAFYSAPAAQAWREALTPLGTDAQKPFLEDAPLLVVIFVEGCGRTPDGRTVKHYYARESVGIATGFLLAALHHAGLACLTYTPSPMGFLNTILGRPEREHPFLVLVVGYPAPEAETPVLGKKSLDEIASFV